MRDLNEDDPQSRYATIGKKWSKTHLTYYVQPGVVLPHVSKVSLSDDLVVQTDMSGNSTIFFFFFIMKYRINKDRYLLMH